MFKNNTSKPEKGAALYLAVVVTGTLLAIGVGISSMLINQLATLRGIGDSVFAFYAADGGIERVLWVDTCIDKTVEADRLSCIQSAVGVVTSIPSGWGCRDVDPFNANSCRSNAIANINPGTLTLANGASYALATTPGGGSCPGTNYCGTSKGSFQQAIRKIRISR